MPLYTSNVSGLGDIEPRIIEGNAVNVIRRYMQRNSAQLPLNVVLPQGSVGTPFLASPSATLNTGNAFIDEWGIPIAAGIGAFTVGLVIAKFARRKKA